ncbi:MAG: hypothetical protein JNIBNLAF_01049 [Nitrosomonas europaea]|nr:hypothetical protein [Nitrosomonas europaea]
MVANSYGLETYQTLKTFMDRQGYKTQLDSAYTVTEQED